jgi:hypothetical protein
LSSWGILDYNKLQQKNAILPILILRVRKDVLNEENGGITTISGFEDEDPDTIIDKDFRYMLMMLSLF